MAYGRRTTRRPRQFIFAATTNETQYLQDRSGNRRFLPIKTGHIDVDAITRDRDQLWGEAAHFEALGEAIYLSKGMSDAVGVAQLEREIVDEWEGIIAAFLDANYPPTLDFNQPQKTTLADVAYSALAVEKVRFDSALQKRVSNAMPKAGWKMTHRSDSKRYWTRVKGEEKAF